MAYIEFVGTCVSLRAVDLDAFDDSSRQITNRTFRKHLGSENYLNFEELLGYDRHLRLANDYHVSYFKGSWRGRPAICCMRSSIHHIWLVGEKHV